MKFGYKKQQAVPENSSSFLFDPVLLKPGASSQQATLLDSDAVALLVALG